MTRDHGELSGGLLISGFFCYSFGRCRIL